MTALVRLSAALSLIRQAWERGSVCTPGYEATSRGRGRASQQMSEACESN